MTELPEVDVIVSTLDEERYVERCLRHVLGQDYPSDRLRAIVVDGGSTDRTVDIVRRLAAADGRLTVIADGRRHSLPEAMNIGLDRATAEFVAKVDAHGYPARDFVRRAVEAFQQCTLDVACVGGRPEQTGETVWGDAAALARTSRFGVGGSVYAGGSSREFVDTVQCGVYRRAALERVGRFDPAMIFGEDDEVNWRLRKTGHRILLDTSIKFTYITRSTLGALFAQYRNYGRAKARVIATHPAFARPWHVAPVLLLIGGTGAAVAAAIGSRAALIALAGLAATYVLAAGAASVARAGPRRGVGSVLRVSACFGAIHSGYAVGMMEGAFRLAGARLLGRR